MRKFVWIKKQILITYSSYFDDVDVIDFRFVIIFKTCSKLAMNMCVFCIYLYILMCGYVFICMWVYVWMYNYIQGGWSRDICLW